MLKNNPYVKAYLNTIVEHTTNNSDDENQFYNNLQLKVNNKLSAILNNSVAYYEQMIKKSEFSYWVDLIKSKLNDELKDENNIDNIIKTAEQISNTIKSKLSNINTINQYFNLDIKNNNSIDELKHNINTYHSEFFNSCCPDLFIFSKFHSKMLKLFSVDDLVKLETESPISELFNDLNNHCNGVYESFEKLYKYIHSNINKFKNKQVNNLNSVQKDTGAKDFFNQPIYIGDDILFFTTQQWLNKHFYIGVVERYSNDSLFIISKKFYNKKTNIKKEDAQNRIINLSKIGDVDLPTFCAELNGFEV